MSVRARVSSGDPVTSDISRSPQAPCPPTNSQVTALHHDLAAPLGWPWSGCEGSVRDRAVLRAAGGAGGGSGADDRPASGPDRRAGCPNRGAGAAAGRLLAQLLPATVERRAGQAGAQVAARPVRAQARWPAGPSGAHAAAGRAAG